MKPQYPTKPIALIISLLSGHLLLAQPVLEFSSSSATAINGPSTAAQVVTFQNNTSNPTAYSFHAFTPTTTATFTVSSQQYSLKPAESTNSASVCFGAGNNNSGAMIATNPTYDALNFVSSPSNSDFSSLPANPGTGISTSSIYGVEVFTSCMGLANNSLSTNGRYYMANVTITFNQPVTNPVIQLSGIGGSYSPGGGTLGFTSELQLVTGGVTLSKISGSSELTVTSNSILNNAANPSSTTGAGAASGSILASGSSITQLVFQVYMRGNGGNSKWGVGSGSGAEHTGDAFLLSVSTETDLYVLPLNITGFTATAEGNSAMLQWSAAAQDNTDHFDVQYSQDGSNWQNIGNVNVSGNPSIASNYNFVQYSPASGSAYYRIAQVNADGSFSYTEVQHVSFTQAGGAVTCYPNPSRGQVTIGSGSGAFKAVQVLSIDGRVLQSATGFRSGESVDLSAYPAGVYVVVIHNTDGTLQTMKVQKI